jgi:predicted nucleic acid-binding Zn ribbon protein
MRRRAPRPVGVLLSPLTERLEPASTLGSVQRCWASVAGEQIAGAAQPVSERDGVLTLVCEDAVWAAELELMGPTLVSALNAAIGGSTLLRVRVRAGGAAGPPKRRRSG